MTVGQEGNFVYDGEHYLKDKGGFTIYYGTDWDSELPREYRYLREILGAGNISNGMRIYLPPPAAASGTPVFYDYPMRFLVNDTDGDVGEKNVILRVLPFAKRTFVHDVEDVYGNPMEARATLTWRGHFDEAAPVLQAIALASATEELLVLPRLAQELERSADSLRRICDRLRNRQKRLSM